MRVPGQRIAGLQERTSEDRRYCDFAWRFTCRKDPTFKPVELGGRWDCWLRRWAGPAQRFRELNLDPQQVPIVLHRHRTEQELWIGGGVGSAKTWTSTVRIDLEMTIRHPGDRFWGMAQTDRFVANLVDKQLEVLDPDWIDWSQTSTSGGMIVLRNGSSYQCWSSMIEDIQGFNVRGILVDEPQSCRPGAIEDARKRVVRNTDGRFIILFPGTPTPRVKKHIARAKAVLADGTRVARVYHLNALENSHHKDPDAYRRLAETMDSYERASFIEGRLPPERGTVFHQYEPSIHLCEVPTGARDVTAAAVYRRFNGIARARLPEWVIGADFNVADGRPMSWVLLKAYGPGEPEEMRRPFPRTPHGWAWWIVGEIVEHNVDVRDMIALARERIRGERALIVYDASTRAIKSSDMLKADEVDPLLRSVPEWYAEPAGPTGNPRQRPSAAAVNAMLRPSAVEKYDPWLYVTPDGTDNVQDSMTDLVWGPNGRIWHGRSPADDRSHCGDPLRYVAHLLYPLRQIDEVDG